jgi:hypothetical protein
MKTAGPPAPRIADQLRDRRRAGFVGRQAELDRLAAVVRPDGPLVTFVLGIGGIGKTSLLEALTERLDRDAIAWRRLDCGAIEPTPVGLLEALGDCVGAPMSSVTHAAEQLAAVAPRLVLALDHYERFRLLDGWLRQELVPALPASVRLVLLGRDAALDAWTGAPGWSPLVEVLRLGPLPDADASALLAHQGAGAVDPVRLVRLCQGHPLALQLAARALRDQPRAAGDPRPGAEPAWQGRPIVEVLAPLFLRDVSEPKVRALLEAACLVRRATRSVLAAMVPDALDEASFTGMRTLPFVEATPDGLTVHETVRAAIASSLLALDPNRYRELRARAWRCLRQELPAAGVAHLWRHTADMIYLVDRPELREAFFPQDAPVYSAERARLDDEVAVLALVKTHDPDDLAPLTAWWRALPRSFHVLRDGRGAITAVYLMALASEVPRELRKADPLLDRWCRHVDAATPALFSRRLLVAATGEQASPLRSACWLSAKRAYFEHRGTRRIYIATAHPEQSAVLVEAMGFERPPALQESRRGAGPLHTMLLDFGPEGVLGWMAGLVDAQFGEDGAAAPVTAAASVVLDTAARALVIAGRLVPLTKLEYGVMHHLLARPEQVVTRDDLLRDVWGQSFGGSNVVDAVVKSLRRKLGPHGRSIATATGHGYRFAGFAAG